MNGQIKERCIYCGSDVYYNGTQSLVRCKLCGHTLVAAKFENELARMNQALKEGEQARKELAEAERARQEAETRLQDAMSSLGELGEGQDVLSQMLRAVMAGQDTAENKLGFLQDITKRILKNQDDLYEGMNILGEIKGELAQIGMDAAASQQYAKAFMMWFQDIHEEDKARLQSIDDKASSLLAEHRELTSKIDQLRSTAQHTQKTLEDFRGQYTKDKLEEIENLYQSAAAYQHGRAYDKAYDRYEQVITKGGQDAQVLWRMVLCYYCVSYQKDEKGNLIPIILNPDLTSPDEIPIRMAFKKQLNVLPDDQKNEYESELAWIDRILGKYRQIRGSVFYDVFISVKQQDDGLPTRDSIAAITLYNNLTAKGLRVFNSRMTPPPAGQEYEPYIISALMSARVMIVVGTCKEYMEAQWVKNEWSRFQWLQKNEKKLTGRTDRLLLCYLAEGMLPEEIPEGLSPSRQAIKADITAEDQLDQALGLTVPEHKNAVNFGAEQRREPDGSAGQVVAQMKTWLFLKKFDKVLEKYESLTESGLYLDEVQVHLCALCAGKNVVGLEKIVESGTDLGLEPLYQLALNLSEGTDAYDGLQDQLKKNAAWRKAHIEKPPVTKPVKAEEPKPEKAEKPKPEKAEKPKPEKVEKPKPAAPYAAKPVKREPVRDSRASVGKILDSWDEIIESINHKTYRENYKIGDIKDIDLGPQGVIPMILAAFDTDELADGSGKAPMTWVAGQPLNKQHRMNPASKGDGILGHLSSGGTDYGWEKSEMRSYLLSDVKRLLPDVVSSHVCLVKKSQRIYDDRVETVSDALWIPSGSELGIDGFEIEGKLRYAPVLPYIASGLDDFHKKWTRYWLRSSNAEYGSFYAAQAVGTGYTYKSDAAGNVILGFCLSGEKQKGTKVFATSLIQHSSADGKILDSWDEIIASIHNKTHQDRYKIGDYKEIDLGPEGVIAMQLVAFDEDELADGSGKAPTTWIAKQLLKHDKRMNVDSRKNLFISGYREGTGFVGGWEKTELRAYLRDTVFSLIPSEISSNIIMVKKYTAKMDSRGWVEKNAVSLENIWLPSEYEITGRISIYSVMNHETTGAKYSIFKEQKGNGMMLKCRADESVPVPWWTRTCSSSGYGSYGIVISSKDNGSTCDHFVYKTAGICIGFCL